MRLHGTPLLRVKNIRGHVICLSLLPADPVVLDLGANRGEFSKGLHARVGGRFKLYEANPQLVAGLQQAGYEVVGEAVADRAGQVSFNIAANDEGSSIHQLPETSEWNSVKVSETAVQARPLQQIVEREGGHVDLLKMDIEGAESAALLSVAPAAFSDVKQITVEFHGDPIFGGITNPEAVERAIQHLEDADFMVLDFTPRRNFYARTDVLFINRRFVTRQQEASLTLLGFLRPRLQLIVHSLRNV